MTSKTRPILLALAVLVPLSACSSFDDWDPFNKKVEPLPGERISVLSNERSLRADVAPGEANVLLPAPTPNPEWPMAGGYANHAMHHVTVNDQLVEVWSSDIGTGADDEAKFVGTPIVAAQKVFAMDTQSEVTAFAMETGNKLWNTDLEQDFDDEDHIGGGLAYERGRVFVATGFGIVFALNADTGAIEWQKDLKTPLRAAPTVRGGRVYISSVDNNLYTLDARNGEQLWTHAGAQEVATLLGGASPAVEGSTVVVPYTSGELFALDVTDGRELWRDNLISIRRTDAIAALAQIRGRPIIDRGLVIAISHAGIMAAIDLRTGRRKWARDIGGAESPWVAGDYIFAITNEREIVCVSRDDGKILWVRGLPRFEDPKDQEGPITWSGPILVGDRLILAGSNGEALAISPYDGHILGAQDMPASVSVPPIVAGGYVFFLADDADLLAYR